MTSPMDPEEDNSNLVSSSGSSPGPFSGDPDACVLQVLPSKPTTPDTLSKRFKFHVALKAEMRK